MTPTPQWRREKVAELRAAELAEMTSLDEAERAAVARHVQAALEGETGEEVKRLGGAVDALAQELGKTPAEVATELAQARALQATYERFVAAIEAPGRSLGDRQRIAQDALDAITRKRERLEARLSGWAQGHDWRGRERLREQIDQLDAAEDEFWPELHPPALGSPYVGRSQPATSLPRCHDCGTEITRTRKYEFGSCAVCVEAFELTGRAWPTIP
jgi:hypothetical protein